MMKIGKKELKGLIKECLIEILAEGLASSSSELTEQVRRVERRPVQQFPTDRRYQPKDSNVQAMLEQHARSLAQNDPVMASILMDTATTTLREQSEAESMPAISDPDAAKIFNKSPEELFGEEASSQWANLAFAGPAKKL